MRAGCPMPLRRRRPASTLPRPLRWVLVLGVVLGVFSMPHAISGAANGAGHLKHAAGIASAAPLPGVITGAPVVAGAARAADQAHVADLVSPLAPVVTVGMVLDLPGVTGLALDSWPRGDGGPGTPAGGVLLCLVILAVAVMLTVAASRFGGSPPGRPSQAPGRLVARLRVRPGSQVLLDKCVLRT